MEKGEVMKNFSRIVAIVAFFAACFFVNNVNAGNAAIEFSFGKIETKSLNFSVEDSCHPNRMIKYEGSSIIAQAISQTVNVCPGTVKINNGNYAKSIDVKADERVACTITEQSGQIKIECDRK